MDSDRVSTFQLDTLLEQSVARFMDEFFYSKLSSKKGIPCRRIYDSAGQKLGIDTTIGRFCIDEKVKVKGGFVSKVIQYPSFEISFKSQSKNGGIVDGWLVKEGLKTDYYALISVFSSETEWQRIRYDNIEKLIVLFVHKKSLLESLCNSVDELKIVARKLRNNADRDDRIDIGDGHLKISLQYPEEPVNLVIDRDTLLKIPHSREVEVNRRFFLELI